MPLNFSSFVVFAEMRTGSNFLESNLNAFPGITCHGEAFNPHFIGYPNKSAILGVDQETRDNNPEILLEAIRTRSDGLGGFRYFHDHDPRVVDLLIDDASCAKIILTRNPVESYVSWKIAQATGQWKLTDMKAHKSGRALFDENEFSSHIEALQKFQLMLLRRLQTQGQTAFYIAYEDLQSVEVMNGLARFLGVDDRLDALDKSLKKQNPEPVAAKVSNLISLILRAPPTLSRAGGLSCRHMWLRQRLLCCIYRFVAGQNRRYSIGFQHWIMAHAVICWAR